ncbi:MAG: hypothetical protein ABI903_10145 [Actinomycetota bacterium]
MSPMMDRPKRVEAARQWFDHDGGSSGLLTWDDVDLVVQLGISDLGVARNLLLVAPNALFASWAILQEAISVEEDIVESAGGTTSASVENRLKALSEWHSSAVAKGEDRDLSGLGAEDLSRIARSGAVTSAALKKLVALSARRVVRGHADEIARVLSGLSAEVNSGDRATVNSVSDVATQPAPVAKAPPVTKPRTVATPGTTDEEEVPQPSWTDFAPFTYGTVAAEGSTPQKILFTATDDELLEMTWSDADKGADVVLYRVKTSDEYDPVASTDLGDLIAVTRQPRAVDARGFEAPVRHVAVWANRGRTEAEARLAQPTLVASDQCVLPVRRCEVRVEEGGTVIGSWPPLNGTVRVDVLRLKSRVANQTSLYDPNYRLRSEQVGVGGFTDRDASPGEEHEYRIYVVARVGDSEEMSQPVVRRVRVRAVVHPVTDLRVTPSQERKNSYELRWSMPPNGDVEIYRSERHPAAGLGQEALSREAIVRAQLSAADKLNYELVRVGGDGLMRDVTWPSEWAKVYFTPVTVLDEQQIRVGKTEIVARAQEVSGVRLIERVDSQFLTFVWPSGMTAVRIFMGPREGDSFIPGTQQPLMELSEGDYRKYGGAHLLNPLPTEGCAVHLVGMTYSRGRAELAEPVSVQYAGLARIDYRIVTTAVDRGRRLGRKAPTPPPKLMAKCNAPIRRIALVLMHHPSRLPLSLMDGHELKRRDVNFEVGVRTEIWPDMSDRPSSGFIRLFAEEPLNDGRPVAVLDPSIDQLRCG